MGENLLHQKTHAPGLISVGLSSSYCTCPDLKGAQTKENKGVELSQNAPRTCTSSSLYSHPRVYSIIFFIFSPLYLLQFRLESSPLSLYSPKPLKNTTPALFSSTCSASLNLLHLRPPETKRYNHHRQSFPIFTPFLCVSSSDSDNFTPSSHQDRPRSLRSLFSNGGFMYLKPSTR